MPQEIRVLQCCECEMFQVDIVKKSNKWQCKVCNTKQSLRKEVFRGSGLDCRKKVQQLNEEKEMRKTENANTLLHSQLMKEELMTDFEFECPEIAQKQSVSCSKTPFEHSAQSAGNESNLCEVNENRKRCLSVSQVDEEKKKKSKWDEFI